MGAQCVRPYEPPDEGATSFGHVYTMTSKHIGRGEFGDVYECFHKYSWVKSAVKFIDKSWMSPKEVAAVHREVALMRELDHPCIVQLVDFFEDRRRFYLVMEMCEGGQLLKRITTRMRRKQPYTEREARDAMHSLLLALACMHNRDIVHRDVKPENLLLVSEDGDAIKLADFGLASKINPRQRLVEWSGTACYMAPEMVNRSPYGKPVDLWSAGVVMFVILCGSHPFFHSCTPVMFNLIRRADFTFSSPVWDHISNDAKDLVRHLLVVDPSKRLTAAQALQHPWIHTEARVLGSRSLDATVHGMIRTIARRRIKAIIYVVFTVHWLRKLALRRKLGLTKQATQRKEVALSPPEKVPEPSSEGEVPLLSEEKVPLTPPRNVVTYNTQLGVTDTGKTAKHVYVFPGGGCDDAECYCVINGQGDTRRHGAVV